MDIISLYTVIPNAQGLLALKYFFFYLHTVKEPNKETLLRLAELVLTLNCFSFADSYYKQINGVAMGTKMGPSYAFLDIKTFHRKQQFMRAPVCTTNPQILILIFCIHLHIHHMQEFYTLFSVS